MLFAKSQLCLSDVEMILAVIFVSLMSAIWTIVLNKVQMKKGYTNKKMVEICLTLYCVLAMWGCVGLFSTKLGMRTKWEFWMYVTAHGFVIGTIQTCTRTFFADLIPVGRECELFALYELTDKGSALIGPMVTTALTVAYPETLHLVFVYLAIMLAWPIAALHWCVDRKQGMEDVGKGTPTLNVRYSISKRTSAIYSSNDMVFSKSSNGMLHSGSSIHSGSTIGSV